jgi:hypothetical protein
MMTRLLWVSISRSLLRFEAAGTDGTLWIEGNRGAEEVESGAWGKQKRKKQETIR